MDTAGVSSISAELRSMLGSFAPDPSSSDSVLIQKTVFVAGWLQRRATELQTPQERRQQTEFDRMLQHPTDKATLMQITDQAFRAKSAHRVADQLTHILDVQGIPRFFSPLDRTLLKGFQSFGSWLPGVSVPLVKEKMQQETANVILPAERQLLTHHLNARRSEGVRMNVNILGEALLGEREAENRLMRYLEALQRPEIEVISVKISTIYSQIWPIARAHTIDVLTERLELLYRAAAKSRFRRSDGTEVQKFVYLDMEEYRDMSITAEAFMRSLERPGMDRVSAGIALQSYVPDSFRTQVQLNQWARQRVARGGEPITIRIVKGANMEMERVEASLCNWPVATYKTKLETDANFKRMCLEALKPENIKAVRLGVASHNLFELAFAIVHAVEQDVMASVQFEMLEGMANPQRRALFELCQNLLLYAPACQRADFIHAIGYLVRRMDENTGPDNFLRHAFKIEVGSPDWNRLAEQFVASCAAIDHVSDAPRRIQDRHQTPVAVMRPEQPWHEFVNEADTDFAVAANARWAQDLVQRWATRLGEEPLDCPLEIAGEPVVDERPMRESTDPSRPGKIVGRYRQANQQDIDQAVACAQADPGGWRTMAPKERGDILRRVAQEVRESRADLMGIAMAEGGKILSESDPEVSEIIDFLEFYSRTAACFQMMPGVCAEGRGVAVVVSPWNFPIAIPGGGVAAALAAGNTVILKPASDTVLTAHLLCQCFWRAGISKQTLQLVPCAGATGGRRLVSHPDVDVVILTGGTETAIQMLREKPDMHLLAETGGKNATIVTTLSDRDQAVKHVLHSAFSHNGQKCSATSLLVLEEEVYDDPDFRRALCDAIQSLHVGSAWDPRTRISPLIRPPADVLETALKELEPGESWAVMPHFSEENPNLVSPAIKWDVQPGSFTHMTEFFGPVLAVMKARNLEDAIRMVNQTGYGLTSGLETLDDREQTVWVAGIRAGNLYVNRSTTGAIVLRQPFGGMGKSAFGPGIKAGGPNYVAQLMTLADDDVPDVVDAPEDDLLDQLAADLANASRDNPAVPPDQLTQIVAAIDSYKQAVADEFGSQHDNLRLVGQDNFRRYLPVRELRVRVHPDDSCYEILARVCAAKAADCRITVSSPPGFQSPVLDLLDRLTPQWAATIEFVEESDDALCEVVRLRYTDRLRYAAAERVPRQVREAVIDTNIYVADAPVLMHGRVELLAYVREQSVCVDYHRYGNLGRRADEDRAEPL